MLRSGALAGDEGLEGALPNSACGTSETGTRLAGLRMISSGARGLNTGVPIEPRELDWPKYAGGL